MTLTLVGGLRSCQKREIIRISQSYNAQQQLARGCAINIYLQPMLRWYCNHKMTFSDIGKGHISQAACIWRITVFFLQSFHIRRGIFLITGCHNLIQKLRGHISIFHQTTIQIYFFYPKDSPSIDDSYIHCGYQYSISYHVVCSALAEKQYI